jgi:hypothetical protein
MQHALDSSASFLISALLVCMKPMPSPQVVSMKTEVSACTRSRDVVGR